MLEWRVAPTVIEFAMHYYYSPEPYPNLHTPASQQALKLLKDAGIIETCEITKHGSALKLTGRGNAWVEMICCTPFPAHRWVDPREDLKCPLKAQ